MLTRESQCDRERLMKLLNGQLPEAAEAAAATHVESCEACRRELETLAAKEDYWRETHDLLSGWNETDDSHLDQAAGQRSSLSNPSRQEASLLTFLAPSDNPAMLGRLGEFEVLEFIGRGGMGLVLKGYDHELNRFVAIKVLRPHYAEHAAARRRFAREAQASAAVVHQHVVAIHAVDATHQPPYFVMPFVPGESLQQRLDRSGPFEVTEVLRIGQQVAEGLAAAHAQGLVHRDIKPANILLERNVERVLITDFGLARAIDDASLTQSGVIAGTPQYMSPEQARGDIIDHRTDLFSLGSVLYALLAGHPPFRADSPYAVIKRVNDDTPRSLREINAHVPDWLEAFIFKLLSKKADERWKSAKEVTDLLRECLAHVQQPIIAVLPSQISTLINKPNRRGLRWAIAAGILIAAALILLLSIPRLYPKTSLLPVNISSDTPEPIPERLSEGQSIPQQADLVIPDEWIDSLAKDVEHIDERLQRLEREPDF
jgi:serine/threonine protein kinase